MTRAHILTWLGWFCFAGGGAAIIVYVVQFARRQEWRRPWNAASLIFTALALTQLPMFLHQGAQEQGFVSGVMAVACLAVAVGLQAVMALRPRRHRRSDDAARPASGV